MTADLMQRPEQTEGQTPPVGTMERIRLLVVDDHPAVRRGLLELLREEDDFLVVATVASADEALSVAENVEVDVVVTDYQLQGRNGLWLSRKLKRRPRPPRVVIYTAYSDGLLAAAAAVAQADGVMSKGSLGSELSQAIRAVARGRVLLPLVRGQFAEEIRARLTDQEQAIYGMRLAGIPAAEIARTLGISMGGLESRLAEMLHKLEAPERPTTRLLERSMLG